MLLELLGSGTVLGGETVAVVIKDNKFVPEEIKVKVGTYRSLGNPGRDVVSQCPVPRHAR